MPVVNGRISTGAVNLDLLRPHFGGEMTLRWHMRALHQVLPCLWPLRQRGLQLRGNRIRLVRRFEQNERALTVQRLTNLPFSSSLQDGAPDLAENAQL